MLKIIVSAVTVLKELQHQRDQLAFPIVKIKKIHLLVFNLGISGHFYGTD